MTFCGVFKVQRCTLRPAARFQKALTGRHRQIRKTLIHDPACGSGGVRDYLIGIEVQELHDGIARAINFEH
ncbi:protein of unknown function [Burkholderia multivorans]